MIQLGAIIMPADESPAAALTCSVMSVLACTPLLITLTGLSMRSGVISADQRATY